MRQIADWLEKLGMSEYTERFTENRIDFSVLPDLTEEELKHIVVVLGDRRKILREIARLDSAQEAAAPKPEALSTLSAAAVQGLPTEKEVSEREDVTLDEIVRDTTGGHPRTNYCGLIAGAVEALDRSTAETRQLIYDRARKALIAHLRCKQLGLSKTTIVKERLALEDAIRKIEAEEARKAQTEITIEPQSAFPVEIPHGSAASESPRNGWPDVLPDGREQLLSSQSSMEDEAVSGFREVVREVRDFDRVTPTSTQTKRRTCEAYEEKAIEFIVNPHDFIGQELPHGDANILEEKQATAMPRVRATRGTTPEAKRTRRSSPYGAFAILLVALIVGGLGAAVFWEWSPITQFHVFLSHTGLKTQTQVSHKAASTQPQLARFPQQSSAETPGTMLLGGQTAAVQRVVLYEENPTDPQGKRYSGYVAWRTERASPGPGPATAVRADVTIPERRMDMIWALRRGADNAGYTIETTFNLSADFSSGAIANVPGILMKQAEQARGIPLAGLAVKVMNGFFIIGLSADETEAERNEQLLKERTWFDIPIVYTNGGRAILAIEKGPPGERAFAEAFATWERK
jgi:hypothetical protein